MRTRTILAIGATSLLVCANTGCGEGENSGSCITVEQTITEDTVLSGCVNAPEGINADGDFLVTVEPGTTITFGENADFILRQGARLNAVGAEDEPILFTGENDSRSFWGGVKFITTQSNENELAWVTIENGGRSSGDSGSQNAALDLNDWGGPVQISITNTTIRGADGYGIRIADDLEITAFTGNTITDNGSSARVTKRSAQYLDDASDLTGNDEDIIDLEGGELIEPVNWPLITGTEYFVFESVTVSGEDDAEGALTIDAGVTARFEEGTWLLAARGGTLAVEGTSDAPVTLAGNEAIAGYWGGVGYITTQSGSNALSNVAISDAGGEAFSGWSGFSEAAAVSLNNWGGPVQATIEAVSISNSVSNGIFVRDNADDIVIQECTNIVFDEISGMNFIPMEADCT